MSNTCAETDSVVLTEDLIDQLVETGGYTHPLFHPADAEGRPLPGQAVLLLAGGLVEQCGVLDDAVALVEMRRVTFKAMARAGDELRVRVRPGPARTTSAGKVIQDFTWHIVRGAEELVAEAVIVMLMNSEVGGR